MEPLPISNSLSLSECGYDEIWLQNQIWENPSCLQLGDLEPVTREKAVSSGGRLDILLKNPANDAMYEVETMLGETDPSHIIRTIEYWDLIKRKWPQRQHFAVLVAEKITARYFNVIHILSNNIPLIAIQASIIEINGARSLHFNKILDTYEEIEDDYESAEIYDRTFWLNKSETSLLIAEKMMELTSPVYETANLVFNKGRISISCEGYNEMTIHRRTGDRALVVINCGDKIQEVVKLLDSTNLTYNENNKSIRLTINLSQIDESRDIIVKIATVNHQWWY